MQRNAIYALLLTVVGLTAIGIVMLFSTSAFAQESHGDIYFFVKRQGFWLDNFSLLRAGRRASRLSLVEENLVDFLRPRLLRC